MHMICLRLSISIVHVVLKRTGKPVASEEFGAPYVAYVGDDSSSCGSFWNPYVDEDSDSGPSPSPQSV